MRLLIITQKVDRNDDLLGFFHTWLVELAARVSHLTVICLFEGEHDLPKNVTVYSLGKEHGVSRSTYLQKFFSLIWRLRDSYDTVFVHMNPIYLVLAGWLWRLMGKRIALWYVHGHNDAKLRIGASFTHIIFTATPQSFPFTSSKLRCVGHGIDVRRFGDRDRNHGEGFRLLHAGRLGPSKHIMEVVAAFEIIAVSEPRATITFVGDTSSPVDAAYVDGVKERIHAHGLSEAVLFVGSVPNKDMPETYRCFDALMHLSSTGGLDKVVIESWCSGVPAFTDQQAFVPFFGEYAERFVAPSGDVASLAALILRFRDVPDRDDVTKVVTQHMRTSFDIKTLATRLVTELETTGR